MLNPNSKSMKQITKRLIIASVLLFSITTANAQLNRTISYNEYKGVLHSQQKSQKPVMQHKAESTFITTPVLGNRSVLWSQMTPSTSGAASQNFEPANDAFDCWGADDFTVSGGPWNIQKIRWYGSYSAGGGPINTFNIEFYNDNAGLPGTSIAYYPANITESDAGIFTTYLPAPLALNNGTYWISIQAEAAFGTSGQFFWRLHDPQTTFGYIAKWQNPGNGFNTGQTTWANITQAGFFDFTFELSDDPPPTCPVPTGLYATGILTTEANIGWTPGGAEVLWNVEVGAPGFTPGTGNEIVNEPGTGDNPILIKDLLPGTTYHVYVQADCGGGDVSPWAGPLVFTTLCEFTCPIGSLAETETCGDTINNGCNLVNPTFEMINPGDKICGTVWAEGGSRDTDWFELVLTEPVEVVLHAFAETPVNFGLLNYGTGTPGNPVCPATAFIAIDATEVCSPVSLNLGILVAGTHWLFVGLPVFNGFPCSINYWIEVETIDVDCPPPTNLTVSNITTNSADLDWTPGGSETLWNIEWGVAGFTPGTGTLIAGVTSSSYQLTGLNDNTAYSVYVQANCGGGELSEWTGPLTFSTLCHPFNLPFTEDFEAASPTVSCWTVYNADGAGESWVLSSAQNHTTGGSMSALHDFGVPGYDEDGWLISPELNIPGSGTSELSFWSYNTWPDFYGNNSVLISTGSNDPTDGDFVEVWSALSVTDAWVETVLDISDYAGQSIYIAFRYEGNDAHGWFVDDVAITNEATTVPTNRIIDGVSNLDECFDATNTIIVTNSTVPSGSMAYFKAGTSITFGDGFTVESGGYMHAEITSAYCNPPALLSATDEAPVIMLPEISDQDAFFRIFPNPTTGNFKLELLGADEADINIEIYGMMGEKVFQDRLFGSMFYEFDLTNMPNGIYFIRVLKGEEMGIEKVIKN
jgi:hypothetical protein